ncbi:MAG: hypothetical protein EA398_08365 [Deltaproteobacteria bacterium]|nr:MAG: hypothetical protein EA398_08365 [Deltaproteobacteria bacterium]
MNRLPLLVLFVSLVLSGCSRCGGDRPGEEGPRSSRAATGVSTVPSTPAGVTSGLAALLPADVPLAIVVRDWDRVFGFVPALRERLPGEAGAIAQAETDLRNTFGIRIDEPESLREIGIASSGGLALGIVNNTPVLLTYLSDAERFDDRMAEILSEQPFNLRGERSERDVDGVRLVTLTREGDPSDRVTFGRFENIGLLFLVDEPGRDVESIVRTMRQASGSSLADREDFRAMLPRVDGMAIAGWVGADGVDAGSGLAEALQELAGGERLGFAVHPRGDGIDVRILPPVSERDLARARAILDAPAPPPAFGRIPGPQAWGVLRLTVNPEATLAAARGDEGSARQVDRTLAELGELLQLDVERELVPALGANVLVAMTRIRAMTLIRALGGDDIPIGDLLDALGAVVAIELADRDVIVAALDRVASAAGEEINRFEDRGQPVYTVRDPRLNLISIVAHDRFLLLVSERQRGATLDRLAETGDATPVLIRDDSSVQMMTAAGTAGGYINLGSLLTGPLGSALDAQVPVRMSQIALFADQLMGRVRVDDAGLRVDIGLRFAPAP